MPAVLAPVENRVKARERVVAALFVREAGSTYADAPAVELWPPSKDARAYRGPHPVCAHPPCARWSRLARLNESRYGLKVGDDAGCFAAALAAVRRWGGVLEHPAGTLAFASHGLTAPRGGAWRPAGIGDPGAVCEVAQGRYGHVGRKMTWLCVYGIDFADLPSLDWASGDLGKTVSEWANGVDRRGVRRRVWKNARGSSTHAGCVEAMTRSERIWTPPEFRDLLLSLARASKPPGYCVGYDLPNAFPSKRRERRLLPGAGAEGGSGAPRAQEAQGRSQAEPQARPRSLFPA